MELRAITIDELERFYGTFWRTMGFGPPAEPYLERERKSFVCDRSVAAFDSGSIVGTTYSHLFELTLPGAVQVPVAGVTAVAVASTHRRRGIVTELMRRQLTEARERGEAGALLLASEGRIYRRFGYGVATQVSDIRIDPRDGRVEIPAQGRVSIIDPEEADKIFPALHDRIRTHRTGSIGRPQHFWESIAADRDKRLVHVVHENASGEADGYARYEVKADWKDGIPAHKATVHDLNATDDAAANALWAYLLSLDLVKEITAWGRPVDESLRWTLDDPRTVRSLTFRDMYWFRPLDVACLLAARTYALDVELTIEVVDALGAGGTFRLNGGPSGAECEPADDAADLRMDVCDLGSISLGGIVPSDLGRAGRIEEVTPGALRRADLAFVAAPRPWGDTGF